MFNTLRNWTKTASATSAPVVETRATDNDPWDWLLGFAGPASIAGPEVSPLTALGVPAVRAAVELIAGIMGTLPVSLYQVAAGGGKEAAEGHPGQSLVGRRRQRLDWRWRASHAPHDGRTASGQRLRPRDP